jgi:hypothetical protein
MGRLGRILAGTIVLAAYAGCGEGLPGVTGPVLAIGLSITGSGTLATAGDQAQFTATARMNDGTQQDVTRQVVWRSTDPAVATVTPGGLVTATGLGVTEIQASFGILEAARTLIVSPVPTYSSKGWVRSPGASAVAGVLVSEPVSRRWTVTSSDGQYSLIGLIGPMLLFEKDGYESVEINAVPNGIENDAAMQQLIRIAPGGVVDDRLAPHDLYYLVDGQSCEPCRRIRIVVPGSGTLRLELTWTLSRAGFRIHAGGRVFSPSAADALSLGAELDVAGGETLVYVGANRTTSREYFPYLLTTSFADR